MFELEIFAIMFGYVVILDDYNATITVPCLYIYFI